MATVHIGRMFGAGGFARAVAIKQLHEHYVGDDSFKEMLLHEARVVARIRHPNVVPTIDLIEEAGELFIVMEFIDGVTLRHLLQTVVKDGERIPMGVVLRVMHGVLQGLHAAHEAKGAQGQPLNLVHRDVAPDNVLVGTDGFARVFDFGIAKALGTVSDTQQGQIKGKVAYMTPEQVLGEELDRRSDVFSASVVLWEALTCKRLFGGGEIGQAMNRLLHMQVQPPSTLAPHIPPEVDALVLRGLQRDKNLRFPTAGAMADAIASLDGIADPAEVGEWVGDVGRGRLASMQGVIAEMDAAAPLEDEVIDLDADDSETGVPILLPGEDGRPGAGRRRTLGLAALAVVAVGLVAFFAARGDDVTAGESSAPTAAALAHSTEVQTIVASASEPIAPPSATVSASASASASVARPRRPPPRTGPPKRPPPPKSLYGME
jgi:serine/threonine-protein kinase